MRRRDWAGQVADLNRALAAGLIDWDAHYRAMGVLWRAHNAVHGPDGWGAVIAAAHNHRGDC